MSTAATNLGVTTMEHPHFRSPEEIRVLERAARHEGLAATARLLNDGLLEQIARDERSEVLGRAIRRGVRAAGAVAARAFTALAEKLRHAGPHARDGA